MTGPLYLDIEQIARVCHETNRAYCMATGDHSQPTWDMAPSWQRASAIEGARSMIANPDKSAEDSHEEWMAFKTAQGWKYGPKKVPELKEHPCMVPYDELPEVQQIKDDLFQAVCRVMRQHTFDVKGRPAKTEVVPEAKTSKKKRSRKKKTEDDGT